MTERRGHSIGVRVDLAAAEVLQNEEPELVARTVEQVKTAAEADLRGGVPRGVAYVRRLQEVTLRRPELGIAVARSLNLDHIVEDLLEGSSVEGVSGISSEGTALPRTRRQKLRLQGKWILAISTVILLIDAVIGDGLDSAALYVWTAVGLVLFFAGIYLVLLKE